jgi:hypothetical protein
VMPRADARAAGEVLPVEGPHLLAAAPPRRCRPAEGRLGNPRRPRMRPAPVRTATPE